MHTVHTPENLIYHFDPLLSVAICTQIQQWLYQKECTQQTYTALQKEFPVLKAVQVRFSKACKPTVHLYAVLPFMRVNSTWAVATNGQCIPLTAFDADAIAELPSMRMRITHEAPQCFDQQTIQTLQTIAWHHADRFAVTWLDATTIWFKDATQPQWNIVADTQHVPHQKMLEQYAAVVAAMQEKNIKTKKGYAWVADMRFADQIIVYGTKGVENEAT